MHQPPRRSTAVLTGAAALLLCAAQAAPPAQQRMTDTTECEVAAERYNAALAKIDTAMREYTKCLSTSRGRQDCKVQFRSLVAAQDEFADSVDVARAKCPR